MDGLLVSELARRSGVPATTLRFYEQQGLLPSRRSGGGYRLYDDVAVDRLAFIATAKNLGLPLSEIRRLLAPWEHGVCAQVQVELAPLLAQRLVEARERIEELHAFTARLEQARAQLAAIERDGPCDPNCAFLGAHPVSDPAPAFGPAATPSELPAELAADVVEPVVVACTLDVVGQRDRVARWRALLGGVEVREAIADGVRLRFDPDRVEVAELAELAAAEARCCGFLILTLHFVPAPVLEVSGTADAPAEVQALVEDMFGGPEQ